MRWATADPFSLGEGGEGVSSGVRVLSAFGDRRLVGPPKALRAFGVPPGGPFDRLAAAFANALVGLPDESLVLEIALGPVLLEAERSLTLAVVGDPDGAFPLSPGERLEVRPEGARAYVACFPSPGPLLSRHEPSVKGRGERKLADPPRLGDEPLRILPGPQKDLLDLDRFLETAYVVGLASNRVGVRLEGAAIPHALSLPSEPAIPGAVQIPPDGKPIVLGPDGPTIGGYPKVAVVIDADLDRLGRARPGDAIRFELVTLEEAHRIGATAKRERERRCTELRIIL